MAHKTLGDISNLMKDIDFCMLQTHTGDGQIGARPMSNNSEVAFRGTNRFFTWEHARMTQDIRANPRVTLTFQGKGGLKGLLGAPGVMIAVQGEGQVITDKSVFAEHWDPSMKRWFDQGIDTPNLVMLSITAKRIDYWDGEENGTLIPD